MRKLKNTKQVTPESILRVYKKGFGYSELKIIDVNDHFFGALANKEFLKDITDGDQIEAYLWVEDIASYEFNLKLIGKIDSYPGVMKKHSPDDVLQVDPKPGVLFFEHTEDISRDESRKCLKAKVTIPIKFFVFDTGDNSKSFSSEEVVFHKGTVIELGDREALIQSNDPLPENTFLKGHLAISNGDIELVGKAVPVTINDERFYNISYTGLKEKERSRILDFVLNKFREL
ncbi:MAG: hypothetical protein GY754_07250 [bacterium]|nr:hypothetical protein [bacterium]